MLNQLQGFSGHELQVRAAAKMDEIQYLNEDLERRKGDLMRRQARLEEERAHLVEIWSEIEVILDNALGH